MHRFLQIFVLIIFSNSIYGQIDTIRNIDGSYEIDSIANGFKEGKWKSFYKNGSIEYEGSFSHGKRVGKWIWYHDNGQILSKECVSDIQSP